MKLITLIITCLISLNVFANARVMPTKVFLSEKSRSFKVSLKHKGKTPKWYTIKAVFYRMNKDGKMEMIKEPKEEERSALGLFRYSPKRSFLKPEQEQVIRISARRKKNLAAGEYRAHLYIVEDELEDKKSNTKQLSMALQSRIAVAIPVFYRSGKLENNIALNNTKVIQSEKDTSVSFQMKNSGNVFAFGTLEAFHIPADGSDPKKVLFIKGVSSYIDNREMSYKLNMHKGKLSKGKLKLLFKEDELRGGELIAEQTVDI